MVYPFTIENISGYMKPYSLTNEKILTVVSSLDQVINANLCGSKDITVLDVNPYTEVYFYLKKAALVSLDRRIFTDSFSQDIVNNKC